MQRRDFMMATGMSVAGLGLSDVSLAAAPQAAPGRASATRFVDTSFGRIAHVDTGRGDAVLFLHGLPLSSYQWRDTIKVLSKERRCLAPDFLGLGNTEVAPGITCSPVEQMTMLLEFLEAKGVKTVDVIASDSGGAVAQHLAAKHPAVVRSLLLANCDTEIDYPVAVLQPVFEMAKRGKFADEAIAAWQADKKLCRSAEGGLGACYADPNALTDAAIDEYLLPLLQSPATKDALHRYVLALEANPLAGIEGDLKKCRVPTRVVWGTEDRIFSTKSPYYLAKTFGNFQGLRMLEGYKLFWPEERPDVVVEEARKLWAAS